MDSVDKGPGRKRGGLPIACNLSEPDMVKQRQEVAEEIFGGYRGVEELADGYSFSFPGDAKWANKLVDFVNSERVCCPFFAFELVFAPELGAIRLKVRGAEGVKKFIEEELAHSGQKGSTIF